MNPSPIQKLLHIKRSIKWLAWIGLTLLFCTTLLLSISLFLENKKSLPSLEWEIPASWKIVEESTLIKRFTLYPKGVSIRPYQASEPSEKLVVQLERNPEHFSAETLYETYADTSRFWPKNFPTETVEYQGWKGFKITGINEDPSFEQNVLTLTSPEAILNITHFCPTFASSAPQKNPPCSPSEPLFNALLENLQ